MIKMIGQTNTAIKHRQRIAGMAAIVVVIDVNVLRGT
jgi:hypothetical protein